MNYGLASLRRLVSTPPAAERCELCGNAIGERHEHLIEPQKRRLVCSCQACALLFDHPAATRYRRVHRDVRKLVALPVGDSFWNRLAIPTGLVFLFESSVTGGVVAMYPSPAGATEAEVDGEIWRELQSQIPELKAMRTDAEALLARRTGSTQDYFIVPIDECYRLTGLIRRHWRGFSGGDAAWEAMRGFFAELEARHA